MTLNTAASANSAAHFFGIDNYSQFDPEGKNRSIVETCLSENGLENVTLIDLDFEAALLKLPEFIGNREVGVLFIDGPHDYRSQYLCLEFAKPHLARGAVIVIDDTNYDHVSQATTYWLLANPEHTLAFEAITGSHPKNLSKCAEAKMREKWWNGCQILLHDPEYTQPRQLPEREVDKSIFVADHIVHARKFAPHAAEMTDLLSTSLPMALARLFKNRMELKPSGRYRAMNTTKAAVREKLYIS